MNKNQQKTLLFFLFFFSVYCVLSIGRSWDGGYHLTQGKNSLEYFFSLGSINEYILHREYYSSLYWTLQYFLTTIFPIKYQIETSHLVNLVFSLSTIFGIGQLGKELFNRKVGKIIFLILFFYPVFFGHMGMNSKDTILAFSHVWITLYVLKYLRRQHFKSKSILNKYVIYIATLAALATGIQLFFLGSLIPIFLFVLMEIFIFKKIIKVSFSIKNLLFDLLKCFLVFYFLLIFFWIDAHPNILILPFEFFLSALSNDYATGFPLNLVNGNYYLSWQVPKLYLLINIFYKSPEYFLITYIFFIAILFNSNKFFKFRFENFTYKLYFIISLLIFPVLLSLFIPFPLYDGLRLFLWTLPYFCILPGLTIYYLFKNFNYLKSKLALIFLSFCIIYFLYNFFLVTPYHYTYLNIFNGKNESKYKKFENDYWGITIFELIRNSNFDKNKVINVATCGINSEQAKKYLIKRGYSNLVFSHSREADYMIMTNRAFLASGKLSKESTNESVKITNCFDRFQGKDTVVIKKKGLVLSTIRKKTNMSNWN